MFRVTRRWPLINIKHSRITCIPDIHMYSFTIVAFQVIITLLQIIGFTKSHFLNMSQMVSIYSVQKWQTNDRSLSSPIVQWQKCLYPHCSLYCMQILSVTLGLVSVRFPCICIKIKSLNYSRQHKECCVNRI